MSHAKIIHLKDYKKPAFKIESVDLHFELGELETTVTSRLVMHREKESDAHEPLLLNGHHLQLISVCLDGARLTGLDYQITDEALIIAKVPAQFTLDITVRIKPQENTALSGLYKSNNIFCTQCEAEGFRRITYFLDRPDVLTSFTTTITADKTRYPVLLSNGNLIAQGELQDGRHWVTWRDPFLKPSYLFALVAGNLDCLEDHFTTVSGRKVTLKVYVDKGNLDKASFSMECIKKAMAWDEKAYGREYDLDIFMVVAINDFNMGAMENKGLNIFNAKYILANKAISTDLDYQNILRVVGHEYFHNWSGNRVTCRDWFQLSLKEGLTIFREQEFVEDMTSKAVARIEEVRTLRGRQFIEDAGPLAHPVRPDSYIEINNFYTNTIYNKGSEVIRMQKTLLGSEQFRKAMDLYFARFDGQAVTIEDFVQCMEDVSSYDLSQLRNWYSQAGTPELTVNYNYSTENKTFTLTVKQHCQPTPGQPHKKPFYMPLAMGLLGKQGQALPLQLTTDQEAKKDTYILIIKDTEQTFTFVNVNEKPVPALLKGFSAPVKLKVDYTDEELLFLLQHEQDGFARWNAGFQLATRLMLQMIQSIQAGEQPIFPTKLSDALRRILMSTQLDQAFIAELLILPSESYLGEQMSIIDVDAIYQVHQFTQLQIAHHLKQDLLAVYADLKNQGEESLTEQAMAARRLKNICLHYLMQLNDEEIYVMCLEQYQTATNMTDRLAAFNELVDKALPEREKLLTEFYVKWRNETLVVDKWLTIQALAKVPGVLQQVIALTQHSAFDIKNPNKVYALIGAFAQNNIVNFHMNTGEGYEFLADKVIVLNKLNPQIAARIVEPLTRWRRYDAKRQALMQKQLQRILAEKDLSKDVYELVSKSLA
jgi:aminopeptidase N